MCGIAGFVDVKASRSAESLVDAVSRMTEALVHRGPDDSGYWVAPEAGIAVGHRRLSILDLSPAGHQPMLSSCGRYVVAFNGEIYNFQELREELEGRDAAPPWRGHSDTEVLLAAIAHFGVEAAIKRCVGMFAFALWDREERTLQLARDRMGEKPLYYGWVGDVFLFASELKALRAHPSWRGDIDRAALTLYLRHSYVPAPYSIYRGMRKLLPGTILTISANEGARVSRSAEPVPYWSARDVMHDRTRNPFVGSEAEAADHLEELLKQSVRGQMVADVPVGVFLSGGLDSSTVAALMQAQSNRPVNTFTIGFHEQDYDEAAHASAVARHLGTHHTELYVTPAEAMAVIPCLPQIYDEPFADSSQIPTFLVSQLARRHVTVSLSGDGGDELFGGYNRYFWGRDIWRAIGWIPRAARRGASTVVTGLSPERWGGALERLVPVLPGSLRMRNPGDKLHKFAEILAVHSPDAMYLGLISHWKQPASVVLGGSEPPTVLTDVMAHAVSPDFTERMMYQDALTYLPDDILVKVDRAAMAVSLETRVPMLDHRVFEFAWRLPLSMKIRKGQGKRILRKVLHRHVPKQLVERPKTGFGVPIEAWLRGPLREWAEELLSEKRLREDGLFDPAPIRRKWREHCEGRRSWHYYLWDVLMFQAWIEHASSPAYEASTTVKRVGSKAMS
jgi:asparagine synthase (glutamine-hydrolysing)